MHYKDIAGGLLPYVRELAKCKTEWLTASKGHNLRTFFKINWDVLDESQRQALDKLIAKIDDPQHNMTMIVLDAYAEGLRKGPKIFCPTDEQFESMQHVDINVPIGDYRQPYPSMVIKLPSAARKKLAEECEMVDVADAPLWCVVYTKRTVADEVMLVINTVFMKSKMDFNYVFQERDEFRTVENALDTIHNRCDDLTDGEYLKRSKYARIVARACLNLMLMMTHYGHKDAGPLLPKEWAKAARSGRSRSEDFRAVDMVQHVVVREHGLGHGEQSVPTGAERVPHWRRGHWRNQKVGPGWSRVKLLFVKPCLIRRDRVLGDLQDSEAIYVGSD